MRHGARGLTLIEMLVILGVVLLLGLIFWPGDGCREKARQATCLSNLKQIGRAAAMYTQDYDGALPWNPAPGGLPASHWAPPFRPPDCAAQPTTSFVTLLQPYIKPGNWLVFHCPSYPGYPASRHLGYTGSLDPAHAHEIGYGFNERLIGSPCRPRTLVSLTAAPAAVVLFGEADQPWAGSPGVWIREGGEWTGYWSVDPAAPERHEAGRSFVFADGHARFLRPLLQPGDAAGRHPRSGYYSKARLE